MKLFHFWRSDFVELRDKVAAIRWHQANDVPQIMCGEEPQKHGPLEAEVSVYGEVELFCRHCGYRTANIPNDIYSKYRERFGK